MKEIIINNLNKIFFGLVGIYAYDIFQKYYNLKYYNKYNNLKIFQKNNVYHIEIYQKKNIDNKLNFMFNLSKKYNLRLHNNFIYPIKYNEFLESYTLVQSKNNICETYNNVKYLNPKNYIIYNNYNFKYIYEQLKKYNNFFYSINQFENQNNIIYKIIKSKSYCLYDNDKLQYLSEIKQEILFNIIKKDLTYIYISIMIYFLFYK